MTLNLACNIESPSIIIELIKKHNILSVLMQILRDSRQDWPTHGASQALMQYSHMSMQDNEIYIIFDQSNVKSMLEETMQASIVIHPEASRHLQDAIGYLNVGESKSFQIQRILSTSRLFATAA